MYSTTVHMYVIVEFHNIRLNLNLNLAIKG